MATFGTQKTEHTINVTTAQAVNPAAGQVCLIAPLDGSATVDANVMLPYRTAEGIKVDHGEGSILHLAGKFAQVNINRFYAVAFDDDATTSSPYLVPTSDSMAIRIGTIPTADLPIYEMTTASIDATAVSRIVYTVEDPTDVGYTGTFDDSANGEIHVNTKTGKVKTSRLTSGAGAGIVLTYKKADLDPVKEQINLRRIEVVTFAGWRYTAQYFGMYDDLVSWAAANNKVVYAAMADSISKASAKPLATAIRSDNFYLLAAKLATPSDDLTTALACYAANPTFITRSLKDKPMPRGIALNHTLPYSRADYGDDSEPGTDTFHDFGVNVLTLDETISSDRCATSYTAQVLFIGFRRAVNATIDLVDEQLVPLITGGTPFDDAGLLQLKGATLAGLQKSAGKNYIDAAYGLSFPTLADTTEDQRKKRTLQGVEYTIRVKGVVHTIFLTGTVSQ